MFCLVGNSPSSGSTFLADLLDSTCYTACGPELELFCNRHIFTNQDKNFLKPSLISTLKATSIYPNINRLKHYGLDKKKLQKMFRRSSSIKEFLDSFGKEFIEYRQKKEPSLIFEKTPQNLNVIGDFLENSDGHFVFLVRDPLYVFNSLKKRGWSDRIAAFTWLIAAAHVFPHLNNPNVHVIKYEDLVQNPFGITANLINSISGSELVSDQEVREGFEHNEYREKASKKLASWDVKGVKVANSNKKKISDQIKAKFKYSLGFKVSKAYGDFYGLPEVSFQQCMEVFGYKLSESLDNLNPKELKIGSKEFKKRAAKYGREVKLGLRNPFNWDGVFNYVEKV